MIGSSTGTNLAIGIALILRDQFSGTARTAGQELDNPLEGSRRTATTGNDNDNNLDNAG